MFSPILKTNLYVGEYWIDPNEGVPEDAIKVYCNFSFNATCLYSSNGKKVMVDLTVRIFLVQKRAKPIDENNLHRNFSLSMFTLS